MITLVTGPVTGNNGSSNNINNEPRSRNSVVDTNTITDLNQSFTTSIYLNQSSSSTVGSSNGLGGAGNCTGGKYPATIIIQVMCCADQNSWKIGAQSSKVG